MKAAGCIFSFSLVGRGKNMIIFLKKKREYKGGGGKAVLYLWGKNHFGKDVVGQKYPIFGKYTPMIEGFSKYW